MTIAFWVCGAITAISAFVSLGYSIAALIGSDPSSRTTAMYATSRSIALAAAAVVALFAGSDHYLEAVALAMVIVQAIDGFIGTRIRDRVKTFGPAATAVANLAALVWLWQS